MNEQEQIHARGCKGIAEGVSFVRENHRDSYCVQHLLKVTCPSVIGSPFDMHKFEVNIFID